MMDRIVFGQYTVQDLLIGAGFVVGVLVLLVILKQIFGRKKESRHIQAVECGGCGWQGRVSRYAGRCPVCNTALGERKADPGR
ncbi:MAG: hypothetical protein JRI70_05785 [Deltaproteobacteria bacterium]|nr:hypothetical protein [Deltaproteobacteria bacterium]MBW2171258.1 hypothetical protein [Deltaproteobacteria bacterium]